MTVCYECRYNPCQFSCDEKTACQYFAINTDELTELKRMYKELEDLYDSKCDYCGELKAENEELKNKLEQADRRYDILAKENEALLLRADRFEAENKELKFENNRLHQWTLNDKKVRHGFELAIETLKKCKECDTE